MDTPASAPFSETLAAIDQQTAVAVRSNRKLAFCGAALTILMAAGGVTATVVKPNAEKPPAQAQPQLQLYIATTNEAIASAPASPVASPTPGVKPDVTTAPVAILPPRPETPSPTPEPPKPAAQIDAPAASADGKIRTSSVPTLLGHYANVRADTYIWIVVCREGSTAYFRQGPMQMNVDSTFRGPAFLGMDTPDELGQGFTVTVAVVPRVVSDQWSDQYGTIVAQRGHFLPTMELTDLRAAGVELLSSADFVVVSLSGRRTPPTPQPTPPVRTPVPTTVAHLGTL